MRSVSVAMATYNGERFLAQQLESIATQTVLPAEIVICDDGSSDRTLDVVRGFQGRLNIRLISNESRLGYRANFLKAAGLCTSPIIAFSDQDDVWRPQKLERCVARLQADAALLVMHTAAIVDQDLKPYGRLGLRVKPRTHEPLTIFPYIGEGFGFSLVFRRELLDRIAAEKRPMEPLQPTQLLTHDTWLLIVASIFGRVAALDEDLVLYRQHGANVSGASAITHPEISDDPQEIAWAHHVRGVFCAQVARAVGYDHPARAVYADLATTYMVRASIYDGRTLRLRALAFLSLLQHGGYRFSRGRMGLPALARDILVGLTRAVRR